MAGAITTPHPPEACYGSHLHCYWHDVDEPAEMVYRVCGECKHAFVTADELLAEHNRVLAEIHEREVAMIAEAYGMAELWGTPAPMTPETDVTQVFCCPFCIHDF